MIQLLDQLRDRLVTVHGLTAHDAVQAIAEHHQHEDSPHRDLVEREADTLIRELAVGTVRDLVVDLTPVVRDVTAALNDFFDTLQAQLQSITATRAADGDAPHAQMSTTTQSHRAITAKLIERTPRESTP
jgi:hypothetical protein